MPSPYPVVVHPRSVIEEGKAERGLILFSVVKPTVVGCKGIAVVPAHAESIVVAALLGLERRTINNNARATQMVGQEIVGGNDLSARAFGCDQPSPYEPGALQLKVAVNILVCQKTFKTNKNYIK